MRRVLGILPRALACALACAALAACGDAPPLAEPAAAPVDGIPRVTLTSVVALDDSTLQVEGDASDPDGLNVVEWWTHAIDGTERHVPIPIPPLATTVHVKATLPPHKGGTYDNPYAGQYLVEVRAADRFWNTAQYLNTWTAGKWVYVGVTKPLLALYGPNEQTLRQLELRPLVSARTLSQLARIDVVVDSGTAAERRLSYDRRGTLGKRPPESYWPSWAELVVEVEVPGPLGEGRHVVSLTAVDDAGRRSAPVRYTATVTLPEQRFAVRALGTLGGADSWASDLAESGVVAGWALDARGRRRAATWRDGRWTPLPAPDSVESEASALNARGDVVGSAGGVAQLWRADGSVVALQTGSCCARLVDVNEAGLSVGVSASVLSAGTGQVFVFDGRRTLTLCANDGRPTAIDESGTVVGATVAGAGEGPLVCNGPARIGWAARRPWTDTQTGPITVANGAGGYVARIVDEWLLSVPRGNVYVEADFLTPYIARATPAALSRAEILVSRDSATGALWLFDLARRTTTRVVLPAEWAVDAVTAIDSAGVIAAHAVHRPTGARGAVLLTPTP